MQAPAKPAALYIQPRLTTIDTTILGGPSHIDDLKATAAVQRTIRDRRVFRAGGSAGSTCGRADIGWRNGFRKLNTRESIAGTASAR